MEYRAQVGGRCQRQNIRKPRNAPTGWRTDIQQWIDEWVERVDQASPFSGKGLRIVEAQIDWRLISNSGVDEGIIRPVIGVGGWPMIPGSGIKGLFRRACPPDRMQRWCGSPCASGDLSPDILRFHGAWPADANWANSLLDVAHPQQNWQVGFSNGRESHPAFGVVSLHRPRLQIGLSCSNPDLSPREWEEIEDTLKRALHAGIGGRTCAGYGSSGRISGDLLFQCALEGQGPAAKLLDELDETVEFRPTMFRAAIRGMALRLFGGLTSEEAALQVVGQLFGSLSRVERQNVGLLATAYTDAEVSVGSYGSGSWEQPIYATTGQLQWRLTRSAGSDEDTAMLAELVAALHGLTMSLGGFGRGWRRADHRIFNPDYRKTPIGCHWQWREPGKLQPWIHVQSANDLEQLLQRSQKLAGRWLQARQFPAGQHAPWREIIHPQRLCIWTRKASDSLDAAAIRWFHWSPGNGGHDHREDPREVKGTDLAGHVNQVGRIWHRMLPLIAVDQPSGANPAVRNASPMARPANPMARPGAATARPAAGAMARPSAANRCPQVPKGEVSIAVHPSRFQETLVLFPEKSLSPAFIAMMDRGADADFQRLSW